MLVTQESMINLILLFIIVFICSNTFPRPRDPERRPRRTGNRGGVPRPKRPVIAGVQVHRIAKPPTPPPARGRRPQVARPGIDLDGRLPPPPQQRPARGHAHPEGVLPVPARPRPRPPATSRPAPQPHDAHQPPVDAEVVGEGGAVKVLGQGGGGGGVEAGGVGVALPQSGRVVVLDGDGRGRGRRGAERGRGRGRDARGGRGGAAESRAEGDGAAAFSMSLFGLWRLRRLFLQR